MDDIFVSSDSEIRVCRDINPLASFCAAPLVSRSALAWSIRLGLAQWWVRIPIIFTPPFSKIYGNYLVKRNTAPAAINIPEILVRLMDSPSSTNPIIAATAIFIAYMGTTVDTGPRLKAV